MLDYIVVGQGLAGSLVALELIKHGYSIKVISDHDRPSSSAAAGGMFNPVTGKHLAKTWMADQIFPFLNKYYKQLETELKDNFFHPTPIYRPFKNENQQSQFKKAITNHNIEAYCTICPPSTNRSQHIEENLGGIITSQGGWVDVPKMLKAINKKLEHEGLCIDDIFNFQELNLHDNHITYKKLNAKKVVFCEGFYAKDNPYFNWLPFNPVKGETLKTKIEAYDLEEIINQNSWIMPIGQNQYRLGATYSWHELDFKSTEKGRIILKERIEKYLKKPFKVLEQIAGVRPATKDRRPIVGFHPKHQNLLIFNGLGTKGVSLAPYFVFEFVEYLKGKKELHPEITIERFYPLY